LHVLKVASSTNRLAQSIAGAAEPIVSGKMNITTATNPAMGMLSPPHKRIKE